MIRIQDFLKPELLGNQFVAIKDYTAMIDKDTKQLSAYRLNVSIQDETSEFYMELITVKTKNPKPTLGFNEMENNKATPVILKDLRVGQYKENLWFSCSDILPAK